MKNLILISLLAANVAVSASAQEEPCTRELILETASNLAPVVAYLPRETRQQFVQRVYGCQLADPTEIFMAGAPVQSPESMPIGRISGWVGSEEAGTLGAIIAWNEEFDLNDGGMIFSGYSVLETAELSSLDGANLVFRV